MKKQIILTLIITFSSIPGLSMVGDLSGTYEKIDTDLFEINVYLPISHFYIKILETNYSIENNLFTNVVNFTVNQNELQILQNSFTITGDSEKEYRVLLTQKINGLNQELNYLGFLISFLLGGIILFALFKLLTKKFKENKNQI